MTENSVDFLLVIGGCFIQSLRTRNDSGDWNVKTKHNHTKPTDIQAYAFIFVVSEYHNPFLVRILAHTATWGP